MGSRATSGRLPSLRRDVPLEAGSTASLTHGTGTTDPLGRALSVLVVILTEKPLLSLCHWLNPVHSDASLGEGRSGGDGANRQFPRSKCSSLTRLPRKSRHGDRGGEVGCCGPRVSLPAETSGWDPARQPMDTERPSLSQSREEAASEEGRHVVFHRR